MNQKFRSFFGLPPQVGDKVKARHGAGWIVGRVIRYTPDKFGGLYVIDGSFCTTDLKNGGIIESEGEYFVPDSCVTNLYENRYYTMYVKIALAFLLYWLLTIIAYIIF